MNRMYLNQLMNGQHAFQINLILASISSFPSPLSNLCSKAQMNPKIIKYQTLTLIFMKMLMNMHERVKHESFDSNSTQKRKKNRVWFVPMKWFRILKGERDGFLSQWVEEDEEDGDGPKLSLQTQETTSPSKWKEKGEENGEKKVRRMALLSQPQWATNEWNEWSGWSDKGTQFAQRSRGFYVFSF